MPYTPPIQISPHLLTQVAEICELVGRLELDGPEITPHLRKENRIRSIQSSLAIENNSLSLEQVSALVAGKRILGPPREIQEVKNAFAAYEKIPDWRANTVDDLLEAHGLMMLNLADDAGRFRSGGVGIYRENQLVHMAPPADRVEHLVRDLLAWHGSTDLHPLIASAVLHYELEFVHPFSDGNGRIGRLWQTLSLSQWKPAFAWLPVETIIKDHQDAYYAALSESDAAADACPFVDFMLSTLRETIKEITHPKPSTDQVSDQVSDQVKRLLSLFAAHSEMTAEELIKSLNLKHRPTFRKNYLRPALEAGLIEMTQPESPNSPTQRYRLTSAGKQ